MAAAPGALDDFTFELCSLVLALSGTRAGVRHIASLPSILTTICTLLTVGTPRLQRQAIVILKRTVLQTMSPDAADKMLRARMQYVRAEGFCGFLMALAASGFSGSVQLRVPGAPMTTVKMDGAGLDARVSWDIALELIELIGQLDGEGWAEVVEEKTTAALRELVESWSHPDGAEGHMTLWKAVAALSVISSDLATALSQGDLTPQAPGTPREPQKTFCTNHDDGSTPALFHCAECGPAVTLCEQCDKVIHLPRATRGHCRTVVEQQQAVRPLPVRFSFRHSLTDGVAGPHADNQRRHCARQNSVRRPRCRSPKRQGCLRAEDTATGGRRRTVPLLSRRHCERGSRGQRHRGRLRE